MFEPLFIECGYCRKSFPFTTTNTSACVIVRGMVMSSKNVRQSWMSFLVLLLDGLVGDQWHGGESSCVWKHE
jgi:hypothetical protein